MAVYDLWASRKPINNINNYTGRSGRLFFDDANGVLRLSDGVTPGGLPIPITLATATTAGGVKIGPGVELNSQGQIIIDSSGLDFNFGDFEARVGTYPLGHPKEGIDYAILSSINADQDVIVASNGEGSIRVVGEFEIYAPNGNIDDVLLEEPVFKVQKDGQIKILVPIVDPLEGAVEIVGSSSGASVIPAVSGVMLHITGNNNEFATVYTDGVNNFSNYIGRRYNGTASSPTQILSGNVLCRFSATGYGTTAFPAGAAASISMVALENFTDTAQGAKIEFLTAPVGGLTRQLIATMSVADGVTATKFVGPLTGNVTGNVSGNAGTVTNGVYTTDTATVTNTMLAGSIANNKLANSSITVNGTSIALGASGTVTAAAGTLTGTTLNSTVVSSSLTSVGTLTNLTVTNTIVGSINGNAATATTATDLTAATGILAGTLNITPPTVNKNSSATATYTLTGLTTNHKVVIMSQSNLPDRLWITAAFASAADTLTVQFQATENVTSAAIDIAYWAWV